MSLSRTHGFGGLVGLIQAGHVNRNIPSIWEYFVTWFYFIYASHKIILINTPNFQVDRAH